ATLPVPSTARLAARFADCERKFPGRPRPILTVPILAVAFETFEPRLLIPMARISKPAAAEMATISAQGALLNAGTENFEKMAATTIVAKYNGTMRSRRL